MRRQVGITHKRCNNADIGIINYSKSKNREQIGVIKSTLYDQVANDLFHLTLLSFRPIVRNYSSWICLLDSYCCILFTFPNTYYITNKENSIRIFLGQH